MDPLTHYLSSKLTWRLFIKDGNKWVVSLFLLAAVFPDIDFVTRFYSTAIYLKYHRGITHSFFGITLMSALLAYLFSIRYKKPFKQLFFVSFSSMLIHIFLDWTNSYGTQLFLPFSARRAALDAIFIIDIYILGVFMLAMVAILITKKHKYTLSLIFSSVVLLYILTKIFFNHQVVADLKRVDVGSEKISVSAFPDKLMPYRFQCVIETKGKYYTLNHSVFNGDDDAIIRANMVEHEIMADNEYLNIARSSKVGKIFMDFSRYPYYFITKVDNNTLVEITNLRFKYSKNSRKRFTAKILISKEMEIIKESFKF